MKFITITPMKYMKDALLTSDTTLVLAHLITDGSEYQKQCLKFKLAGGKIIMDNSFYELRSNMPVEELVKKANLIKADVLVLPDVPWRDNFHFIVKHTMQRIRKLGYKGKFMATVYADNGDFKKDLAQFKILNEMKDIDIISVPYSFNPDFEFRRPEFLNLIEKEIGIKNIQKSVHMFGCNSLDNLQKEKRSYVSSIDGSMPWKCGFYKMRLPVNPKFEPRRPTGYIEIDKCDTEQYEYIVNNLKFIKKLCEE